MDKNTLILKKKKLTYLNNSYHSRKISTFALLTMPKPLTVWLITNCGKFFMRWDYQTT